MAYRARDLEFEILELRKHNERLREALEKKAKPSRAVLAPFHSSCPSCGGREVVRRYRGPFWPFRRTERIDAECSTWVGGCGARWKERTARMELELEEQGQ